jgi:hypothetical protein
MAYESMETGEKLKSGGRSTGQKMTLQKAVDMGEYDPEYLATFAEWHTLSRHVQFQFIRQGLDNRNNQLLTQWAIINNTLDFRLKPQLAEALENIQKQMKRLDTERERLYFEYSR